MSDHSPLDLLVAGLLSHGFKELSPAEAGLGWRRFQKWGREDRWVRERDLLIVIGKENSDLNDNLWIPLRPLGRKDSPLSDQHALLMKCGQIHIRTKENQARRDLERRAQGNLRLTPLDADEMLDELGGL